MPKTSIAIACQGGGSQTAFTAGVLKTLFADGVQDKWRILSLSGTSGGAVCAALAWYGMLKAARGDRTPIQDRLTGFWEELSAQHPEELALEHWGAQYLRMIEKGHLARYEMSPAGWLSQAMFALLNMYLPRHVFTDLRAMLEKHIDFGELPRLMGPESPLLVVGAADVLTGELKKFYSDKGEIRVEAILASAAVPNLFPAVQIGEHYYWDGLFSDNPPIKELVRSVCVGPQRIPDELWILKINPTRSTTVPTSPAQIVDRRNQMVGNVSFEHSLEFVEFINYLLTEKGLSEEALNRHGITRRDPIKVRIIRMSDELMDNLDYVSKLSREPAHIARLIREGEQQGRAFLDGLAKEAAQGPSQAADGNGHGRISPEAWAAVGR